MNQNIEVINDHLWSVRFSLIPLIPGLQIEPKPDIPLEKEICRNIQGAIMVLNAEHRHYDRYKENFLYLQKQKLEDLKQVLEMLQNTPNKNDVQVEKQFMIRLEIDRRFREEPKKLPWWKRLLKGVKLNGNNTNSNQNS